MIDAVVDTVVIIDSAIEAVLDALIDVVPVWSKMLISQRRPY